MILRRFLTEALRGLLKFLISVREWARNLVQVIKNRFLATRKRLDDWLYRHDITWRVFKHYGLGVVGILLGISMVIGFSIIVLFFILPVAPQWVTGSIQFLYNFGVWLHLSNPGDFVTIVVAEIIAIFGSSLVLAIIGRMMNREPREAIPKPRLVLDDGHTREEINGARTTRTYRVLVSNKYGETAALDCQARIEFNDLDKRDIIDMPSTQYTSNNFTRNIKAPLSWTNSKMELTIRAGDDAEIDILVVTVDYGSSISIVPPHFRVLNGEGWNSTLCLNPHTFYGNVRVVPLNGKPTVSDFQIKFDRTLERWVFTVR